MEALTKCYRKMRKRVVGSLSRWDISTEMCELDLEGRRVYQKALVLLR